MRIAVNLLPFRAHLAGAGRYTQNILRELVVLDPDTAYTFFVAPRAAAHFTFDAPNITQRLVNLPDNLAARIAYEQFVLPLQSPFDVLFTPSVAIPLAWRGKKVTVIYDMMAEHPALRKYPPLRRSYVRSMSRYAAQHSDSIVTISEHSQKEIAHYAGVPYRKIVLASPATDFHPVTDAQTLREVRERYHLPERFILYVGTLEPGKNLPFLVRAYALLKRAYPELEQHLVLAGASGWGVQAIEHEISKSDATGFHVIGFVEQDDLAALYSMADVFVYPSLYEGFGMPPLEAMACGTPVIVSSVSAMPEILGALWTGQAAGLSAPPDDEHAWRSALAAVLTDPVKHEKLRTLGLARAQEFLWRTSAETIRQALHAV